MKSHVSMGFQSSLRFLFLVEISGIEPLTSCLQGRRSPSWAKPPYPYAFLKWWAKDSLFCGKATAVATVHRTVAKSRLSSPFWRARLLNSLVPVLTPIKVFLEVVGQNGLEPSTSRLSVVCSSQLSYWPISTSHFLGTSSNVPSKLNNASITRTLCTDLRTLLEKNSLL